MIRTHVSFPNREGWLVDFEALPREGDLVALRDLNGELRGEGRVELVRHLVFASGEYRAGAHQVEIELTAHPGAGVSLAEWSGAVA